MVKENVGFFPPAKVGKRKKNFHGVYHNSLRKQSPRLPNFKTPFFMTVGDDGGAEIIKEIEEDKGEGLLQFYLNLEQSKTVQDVNRDNNLGTCRISFSFGRGFLSIFNLCIKIKYCIKILISYRKFITGFKDLKCFLFVSLFVCFVGVYLLEFEIQSD